MKMHDPQMPRQWSVGKAHLLVNGQFTEQPPIGAHCEQRSRMALARRGRSRRLPRAAYRQVNARYNPAMMSANDTGATIMA